MANRPRIKWKIDEVSETQIAYSGKLAIGFVCRRIDGSFGWQINAVHYKWITKGAGDTRDFSTGRRALVRAWRRWCRHAGLTSV